MKCHEKQALLPVNITEFIAHPVSITSFPNALILAIAPFSILVNGSIPAWDNFN
jgi:hypothetical protein